VELKDTKSKLDKSRIGGLVPRWESRTIHVAKFMEDLLKEFYEFRLDDTHSHDDMLDAIADCFNPEMAHPNYGKQNKRMPESRTYSRPFISLGVTPEVKPAKDAALQSMFKRLDRRIYDAA
jgi:hypothetical protein